jgi:hypothetical protein
MTNPLLEIGPQPIDITPSVQNPWMLARNQAFNTWVERYLLFVRNQGFGVVIIEDTRRVVTEVYQTGAYVTVQLVKQGVTADIVLSITRAQGNPPEVQAELDIRNIWAFNAAMAGANPAPLEPAPASGDFRFPFGGSSTAAAPDATGSRDATGARSNASGSRSGGSTELNVGTVRTSNPASTSTVRAGFANYTAAQSPPPPDTGTAITPAGDSGAVRHNWDEWNWYYQQETGRPGFAPELAGVTNRSALLTRDEWWAKAGPLYEGESAGAGAGEPPANGGGMTAGEAVSIIGGVIAAILAALGLGAR